MQLSWWQHWQVKINCSDLNKLWDLLEWYTSNICCYKPLHKCYMDCSTILETGHVQQDVQQNEMQVSLMVNIDEPDYCGDQSGNSAVSLWILSFPLPLVANMYFCGRCWLPWLWWYHHRAMDQDLLLFPCTLLPNVDACLGSVLDRSGDLYPGIRLNLSLTVAIYPVLFPFYLQSSLSKQQGLSLSVVLGVLILASGQSFFGHLPLSCASVESWRFYR